MAFRFEFIERAIDEARAIFFRKAERSPEGADRWYRGLIDRIDTLKTFPLRCPIAPESGQLGGEARELLYGKRQNKYRVIFEVRADLIAILSVRHSAGRPEDV